MPLRGPGPARPLPWNQCDPPCSFPPWPPGPRQGWAAGSNRFWLLELRLSRTFLDQLRPQLFRPWIPNSMRGQYLLSRSDRFRLFELRVSRHFSTFYGPSVQSMDTQLGARQRRRTPTIHRGSTQRTISAGSWFAQGLQTSGDPARTSASVERYLPAFRFTGHWRLFSHHSPCATQAAVSRE